MHLQFIIDKQSVLGRRKKAIALSTYILLLYFTLHSYVSPGSDVNLDERMLALQR